MEADDIKQSKIHLLKPFPSLLFLTPHTKKMELQPSTPDPMLDLENPNNGTPLSAQQPHLFSEDFDSTCSTPYVSAPSSPGRATSSAPINGGFFYSCPASPMHFAMTATAASYSVSAVSSPDNANGSVPIGYEFEFSARLGSSGFGQTGSMSSADELFLNGQIRPTKLSTHLERPQVLAPLLDIENEEEEEDDMDIKNGGRIVSCESKRGRDLRLRDKSLRRRTRSMSPLRSTSFELANDDEDSKKNQISTDESCESSCLEANGNKLEEAATPSVSASSSRSSSAGRNSKRWVFLKDFLYRSKSEGRSNNKFWSNISFSPAKEKKSMRPAGVQVPASTKEKLGNTSAVSLENQKVKGSGMASSKKPVNGVGKRRVPTSPHELHYKASKAQAEEMRKKTFLPYRQGLLGCLGFSSKGYGAMNVFARALNPVSSSCKFSCQDLTSELDIHHNSVFQAQTFLGLQLPRNEDDNTSKQNKDVTSIVANSVATMRQAKFDKMFFFRVHSSAFNSLIAVYTKHRELFLQ